MRIVVLIILAGLGVAAVSIFLGEADHERRRLRKAEADALAAKQDAAADEKPAETEPAKDGVRVKVTVKTADGKPIVDGEARVLIGYDLKKREWLGGELRTDENGEVEVPMPEGGGILFVRHQKFRLKQHWLRVGYTDPIEIVLDPGAPLRVIVFDPGRKPLAGVEVTVRLDEETGVAGMWSWKDDAQLDGARTDSDGVARLGAAPVGQIVVRASHTDFAPTNKSIVINDLEPVEEVIVLDLGGTVTGSVLSPNRDPVGGARVHLRGDDTRYTKTKADGTYILEALPIGAVEVVARADGFGPGYFGDELGWGEPVPIRLKSGETQTGIDIVLSQAAYLRGRIVMKDKTPVEGVNINLGVSGNVLRDRSASVVTDKDGRFVLGPWGVRKKSRVWLSFWSVKHSVANKQTDMQPGEDKDLGELIASLRGVVRGTLLGPDGKPTGEGSVWASGGGRTEMREDGTFEITGVPAGEFVLRGTRGKNGEFTARSDKLKIANGQVLEGITVRLSKTQVISGVVLTPTGELRAKVSVGIVKADLEPPYKSGALNRVTTDSDGKFSVRVSQDGEYRVGVTDWIDGGWGFHAESPPTTVDAGAEGVELTYPVLGAVLKGSVVSKRDGKPIKKFQANFVYFKSFIPWNVDINQIEDAQGRFQGEVDEPGSWAVDVSAPGHASFRTQAFALKRGEIKDVGVIRLGDGGIIRGKVLDHTGRPVQYARINILSPKMETNSNQPFTDREGAFHVAGIAPGLYTVFAVSPSHPLGIVRNIDVKEAVETVVDVQFLQSSPLHVRVRDAEGNPLEGVKFIYTFDAVRPLTSDMFRSYLPPGYGGHKTGPDGRLVKPALPPGPISITLKKTGYRPRRKTMDLKPGEVNQLDVRLQAE
ncbi:MAG: carboxypeptidase-like regulatory domain-containing protein [Planctomycetota bacterium]